MLDIPEPGLVPKSAESVDEYRGIVEPPPTGLTELHEGRWFTYDRSTLVYIIQGYMGSP